MRGHAYIIVRQNKCQAVTHKPPAETCIRRIFLWCCGLVYTAENTSYELKGERLLSLLAIKRPDSPEQHANLLPYPDTFHKSFHISCLVERDVRSQHPRFLHHLQGGKGGVDLVWCRAEGEDGHVRPGLAGDSTEVVLQRRLQVAGKSMARKMGTIS